MMCIRNSMTLCALVLHSRDAGDRAEDEHGDDHRDQPNEGIAQRLHGDGATRAQIPERDSNRHSDENLHPRDA
jgi:hypothetical protein